MKGVLQTNFRKLLNYSVSLDYIGTSATTNLTISEFDENSGKLDLSFIESYNSRISCGAQFIVDKDNGLLKPQIGIAARYSLANYTYAMTLAWRSIHLSYWTQINDRLQFATKMEYNEKYRKFLSCFLYQFEFENACIRGQFNSDLSVGVSYNRFVLFLFEYKC